jgi:uncharacterized protein (TIGR02453 family)
MEAMAFKGWPSEALEFYEGLQADNSKTYWQSHKDIYETCVLAPMEVLLADLAPEFGAAKIFRPYRDVRFSADKSPYKTAIGATLEKGGYVQFSANGLGVGCGRYVLGGADLDRYRKAVDDDRSGSALVKVVADAERAGMQISGMDALKTVPRGYPADHPRRDLLRRKGIITWQEWPVAPWLGTAKAKDRVVTFLRKSRPLQEWLREHVGEGEEEPIR